MKKILLVAFSCQPGKGSEPGSAGSQNPGCLGFDQKQNEKVCGTGHSGRTKGNLAFPLCAIIKRLEKNNDLF